MRLKQQLRLRGMFPVAHIRPNIHIYILYIYIYMYVFYALQNSVSLRSFASSA